MVGVLLPYQKAQAVRSLGVGISRVTTGCKSQVKTGHRSQVKTGCSSSMSTVVTIGLMGVTGQ